MRRRFTGRLLSSALAMLAAGGVGALVASRRARNPIGWMPRETTS